MKPLIFKFGGASVKDPESVKNLIPILQPYLSYPMVIVISAMGKTTNALEKVVEYYFSGQSSEAHQQLHQIREQHLAIARALFPSAIPEKLSHHIHNLFVEAEWILEEVPSREFDFYYDQLVFIGEMLSTSIISEYLNASGVKNEWLDARDFIKTDNTYRAARVDWKKTEQEVLRYIDFSSHTLYLTQGFIGSTAENYTTTLGREGSDFTASILAYCLNAEKVIIWKDVPGVMNADPKIIHDAVLLPHISYKEAIELTYYGATVIHPKTLKPLQNKSIPLLVKSFLDPSLPGTLIDNYERDDIKTPSFIFRPHQILMSFAARDYSFIAEDHLSEIFRVFASLRVKINLMQTSAINFTLCFDHHPLKLEKITEQLKEKFKIRYNQDCLLITIRHYTDSLIKQLKEDRKVLIEQRSRNTFRMVVKANPGEVIYSKYQ